MCGDLSCQFQGRVFVHEIHPGGPAEKAGKIKLGQKLTKVNDTDFNSITNSLAMECLRGASEKVKCQIFSFDRRSRSGNVCLEFVWIKVLSASFREHTSSIFDILC